jgi:hypothetical protein
MHPRHFQKSGVFNQHQNTKNQSQNTRWPSNDIPQFALHNLKLIAQNNAFMFLFIKAFGVINEQPNNVKKSGEPAHHKNQM